MELGLPVGVFDPYGRPCRGHQCGFEPWGALAHSVGATFAGTFVATRKKPRPEDQMGRCEEARHVDADLATDLRGQIADPGQSRQEASAITDRRQGFSHRGIDVCEGLFAGCHEFEMHPQRPPVIIGARRGCAQATPSRVGAFLAGGTLSEVGEPFRVRLPGKSRQTRSAWRLCLCE